MITPEEIRQKAVRIYPAYLTSLITGESFFPKIIRSDKSVSDKTFASLQQELTSLLQHSKEKVGYGYYVRRKKVKSPRYGEQELPEAIVFDEDNDLVKWLDKENEVSAFKANVSLIIDRYPQLKSFVASKPLKIAENNGHWEDLLKVCDYFIQNPRPNLYIRELPISVHTKFIKEKRGIIAELLEILIPEHINLTGESFEEKFNLKKYESYFNLRILDKSIAENCFSGLTDIGVTPSELARFNIPCKRIIILENKQTFKNIDVFLSFPQMADTIALFGSGFHAGALKQVKWLREKELYYWGDIDVHGFQILSQLRSHYPSVRSFLMDKETFDLFHSECGKGVESNLDEHSLSNLTDDEKRVYVYLLSLDINKCRLEQEKISHAHVIEAIARILI